MCFDSIVWLMSRLTGENTSVLVVRWALHWERDMVCMYAEQRLTGYADFGTTGLEGILRCMLLHSVWTCRHVTGLPASDDYSGLPVCWKQKGLNYQYIIQYTGNAGSIKGHTHMVPGYVLSSRLIESRGRTRATTQQGNPLGLQSHPDRSSECPLWRHSLCSRVSK